MTLKLTTYLTATTLCLGSTAMADTLSYAGGWPPSAGATKVLETYAEALGTATGGDLTMKVYPLSLLNFAEANEGVKDGLADMATILTPYFSAEYPHLNMLGEASPMMEKDAYASDKSFMAYSAALAEYVMLGCDDCQTEVAAQNQVYLGSAATTSYILQCMSPVGTLEELKGKRIRTAGPYWSRWVEGMGAVPVTISINETFEALNQGVLDCTASNPTDLKNFGFIDAVSHVVTGAPGGQFPLPTTINRDRWAGLDVAGREALLKATAGLFAGMNWVYYADGKAALSEALDKGVSLEKPGEDLAQANQGFIDSDLQAVAGNYGEKYQIQNAAEMIAGLETLVARWSELVADIDSEAALAELYWTEIYAKVDAATYGQ